jgi:hypothetical protein
MSLCSFGLHDWAYSTRTFTYRKNGFVTDEREEVFKRTCARCNRVERNVGPYSKWVRVAEDAPESGSDTTQTSNTTKDTI